MNYKSWVLAAERLHSQPRLPFRSFSAALNRSFQKCFRNSDQKAGGGAVGSVVFPSHGMLHAGIQVCVAFRVLLVRWMDSERADYGQAESRKQRRRRQKSSQIPELFTFAARSNKQLWNGFRFDWGSIVTA